MPTPIPLPDSPPSRKAGASFRLTGALEHAANEIFPAPHFASAHVARHDQPATPRLAGAFLISVMLHLGLAILVSSTLTYTVVRDATSPPLTVTLAQAPVEARHPADVPIQARVPDHPREPQVRQESIGPAQQPARFLVDPDLSVLEEIPTTLPGIVSLRLHVTTKGTVEHVSVIRADPVPKELLDGLIERFGKAKLSPALVGSQTTASTLEVTIRVDPPAQFFEPVR